MVAADNAAAIYAAFRFAALRSSGASMVITDEPPTFRCSIAEPSAHDAEHVADVVVVSGIRGIGEGRIDGFHVFGINPTGAGEIIRFREFYRETTPLKRAEFEGDTHVGKGRVYRTK